MELYRYGLILVMTTILGGCAYTSVTGESVDFTKDISTDSISVQVLREVKSGLVTPTDKTYAEISSDAQVVASKLKRAGITTVTITLSEMENRYSYCRQCAWILFLIPNVSGNDLVLTWNVRDESGKQRVIAQERSSLKRIDFLLLFPYSVYYVVKQQSNEMWDPDAGFGSNLLGGIEAREEFVRLNRKIIKVIQSESISL